MESRYPEGESMLDSPAQTQKPQRPVHNHYDTRSEERFSKHSRACRTRRVLWCLVYLLACVSVVLLALFLVYFFKYQRKVSHEVCQTSSCVIAASQVAVKMNASVDPCEDFVQFACGNFYRTATYSEGKTYRTPFSSLEEDNIKLIKSFLSEEEKAEEWTYLKNMKRLYKACLDEGAIEKVGLRPYLDSPIAREWPTLIGRNWSGDATFDLNRVNSEYMSLGIQPLFSISITVDIVNSSKHSLSLGDPHLSLATKILRKPRDAPEMKAFEQFLTEMAVELGAEPQVAAADAAAVLDLDSAIAKVLVPQEERRNFTKAYNPSTLAAVGDRYSFIDIPGAARSIFSMANMTLGDNQEVIVKYPSTYEKIHTILNNTDKRTLQNSFSFKYANSRTHKLTKRMRDIALSLEKILYGKTEQEPRSDICVDKVVSVFPFGIGKEFIRKNFPEDSKIYMNSMIDNLQTEFENQLHAATWLGKTTKAEAFKKLALMSRKIGYPDKDFSESDIDEKYENLTMSADNFYGNLEVVRVQNSVASLLKLREKTDKHEWNTGPHIVNAFYDYTKNSIFFPAGILQPPFFSAQYPDSLNYGAIGVVIGHEITHGFDDKGSQFDQDGNLRDWWQAQDKHNFDKSRQCIVEQYGNFTDDAINMNVNGINTQGENVADNGGLKQSYRAYKKLMAREGEPKPLPGLGLTNDQTFFLGYAQLWCMKMTDAMKRLIMLKNSHPPGQFRILGPLQNSPEFAKAYNCPVGSKMNPEKKCSVW